MRVDVDVTEIELEGDHTTIPGLAVECSRCGHVVEVYGTSGASERRGCAMLREDCPYGESNFYGDEAGLAQCKAERDSRWRW